MPDCSSGKPQSETEGGMSRPHPSVGPLSMAHGDGEGLTSGLSGCPVGGRDLPLHSTCQGNPFAALHGLVWAGFSPSGQWAGHALRICDVSWSPCVCSWVCRCPLPPCHLAGNWGRGSEPLWEPDQFVIPSQRGLLPPNLMFNGNFFNIYISELSPYHSYQRSLTRSTVQ